MATDEVRSTGSDRVICSSSRSSVNPSDGASAASASPASWVHHVTVAPGS
ncbi:MAG: hypothetical protein WKF58_19785 [Ilumatobacteraceae bacterium]